MNETTLRNFLFRFHFEDLEIEHRRKYQSIDMGLNGTGAQDFLHIDTITEEVVKCKLPRESLERIADIISEWDQLYRNPETAKLLHEARFINRLHKGLY